MTSKPLSACCNAEVHFNVLVGGTAMNPVLDNVCSRCGKRCSLAAEQGCGHQKIEKLAYEFDTISAVRDLEEKVNEVIDYMNEPNECKQGHKFTCEKCPICEPSAQNRTEDIELKDIGCWRVLQAIIQRTFEQARIKKYKDEVREWARQKPNMVLSCYSQLSGYDYDQLVKRLVSACDRKDELLKNQIIKIFKTKSSKP